MPNFNKIPRIHQKYQNDKTPNPQYFTTQILRRSNKIKPKGASSLNTYDVTNIYIISQNVASNYILVGHERLRLVVLTSGNIAPGPKDIISQISQNTHTTHNFT